MSFQDAVRTCLRRSTPTSTVAPAARSTGSSSSSRCIAVVVLEHHRHHLCWGTASCDGYGADRQSFWRSSLALGHDPGSRRSARGGFTTPASRAGGCSSASSRSADRPARLRPPRQHPGAEPVRAEPEGHRGGLRVRLRRVRRCAASAGAARLAVLDRSPARRRVPGPGRGPGRRQFDAAGGR